ncbi:MAG: hypothetical protein IPJ81_09090 [Chitinophagaceae bacterium]|nr:hypothetical protein [Chitinophagaceae bacterium]
MFKTVLAQKRSDSGKVYSLHEPDVKCYTKGKGHKNLSLEAKPLFSNTKYRRNCWGIKFYRILHDSKTLPSVLEQYERLMDKEAKNVFLDRGYRGLK